MNLKISVLTSVLLLGMTACYEDIDTPIEEEVVLEEPEIYIDTGITGRAKSKDGSELEDYVLEINGISHPQEAPFFLLPLENVKKEGQLIQLYKDEVLLGMAFSYLIENDVNPVDIYTFPEHVNSTHSSTTDLAIGNLELSFTNSNGADQIELAYIDHKLALQSGFSKDKKRVLLRGLEGVHIGLKDLNGSYLEGLSFEGCLQSSLATTSDISLFFMDKNGKWQWEADGNTEEIPITKTGFYLFASAMPAVIAEGEITKDNAAIAYQDLQWEGDDFQKSIKSSVNGRYIDVFPAQSEIALQVKNPCKETIQESRFSTENKALEIPTLEIQSEDNHLKLISQIIGCQGNKVDVPAVKITNQANGTSFFLFGAEQIDNWVPVCGREFQIAAYDVDGQNSGPSLPWTTQTNDNVDFLSECSDFAEGYSYIEINGESKVFDPFKVVIENGQTFLSSQDNKIRFRIQGDSNQRFEVEDINVYINDESIGSGYFIACESSSLGCGLDDFVITHLDMQNGWVRASFSGEMWMQKLNPRRAGYYPVSGQILIKQD